MVPFGISTGIFDEFIDLAMSSGESQVHLPIDVTIVRGNSICIPESGKRGEFSLNGPRMVVQGCYRSCYSKWCLEDFMSV